MSDHQLRPGSSGSWWSAASLATPVPEVADLGGSFRWTTAADMDVFEAQLISNPQVSAPATVGFGLSSPSLEWSQPFFSSSSNGGREDTSWGFHGLLQEEVISRPCVQRHSGIEDSTWSPLKTMNPSFMHDHRHHHVLSSNASCELPSSTLLPGLLEPDSRLQRSFHDHREQLQRSASARSPQFSNETCFWNPSAGDVSNLIVKTTAGVIRSSSSTMEKRNGSEPALKKARTETPSPLPTFKVRKEKLGDRITALQQLVSPFGKTDTASVLQEAIEYIKFLHDQVRVLSAPYLKNGHQMQQVKSLDSSKDSGEQNQDLRSRGLCLVPMSSTFAVANEIPADLWTPPFIGTFR